MVATYDNLYGTLCSYDNLHLAFKKARKRKSHKLYVLEFESALENNLKKLQQEILTETYKPEPLKTFIIRDPKTRKISKSHFRDRVIHHAICNIIEPIFEKVFICDSFANRKGKGVHSALKRFDNFKRKVSGNNTKPCYVLKADIRHYFDTVDQEILIGIISRKIKDEKLINLIRKILANHKSDKIGKGMPLGNLTSQFFANVYLNELDYFVKHRLKAKYYLRYVDDFVILHSSKSILEYYKATIDGFLRKQLKLELHPDKSKIKQLNYGVGLLGYRVFYYHKLLRKTNIRKFLKRLSTLEGKERIMEHLMGWFGYALHANTYGLRCRILRL
jgi:retron-type reverse transcriptase